MPVGKASQVKGRAAEREVRDIYIAHGFDVRLHGPWEANDLTVTVNGEPKIVEVKRRKLTHKEINEILKVADILWCRANYEDWKVYTSARFHCGELNVACGPNMGEQG